jgi:Phosphotransferase enzyme family
VDLAAAEQWIRAHVDPAGPVETAHERPWATVLRVPLAGGTAWFKACAPLQAFEVRLSAELSARWPDLVAEVLAHDEERSWLLLADAGSPVHHSGTNPPELWLELFPLYAELQRGETTYAAEHVAHGVPDLRLEALPERYDDFLRHELPLAPGEIDRLRRFAGRFAELCEELGARGIPASVQHDDLHTANVYAGGGRLRVLDWGDSSIAHPFFSPFETFRFLEGDGIPPGDAWYTRLRDAYLEPWGPGHEETFSLALRVGAVAHSIAWARQRDHLPPADAAEFDVWYPLVLRYALAATSE